MWHRQTNRRCIKHFSKRKNAEMDVKALAASHGSGQRWMRQIQRPTLDAAHWAAYTLKTGFKIKLREESIYSIQMLLKMKHD